MSRAPKGASAMARPLRPLAGVRWASWFDAFFYFGTAMLQKQTAAKTRHSTTAMPPPPTAEDWTRAVAELGLTPRQTEVVRLVLQAKRDKQIAAELGLGISTVRMHLRYAFAQLGISDRMELHLRVIPLLCGRCSSARQSAL